MDQSVFFFYRLVVDCCFGDLSGVVVARICDWPWVSQERLQHCLAGTGVDSIAHPAQHQDGLSPVKATCVIVVI